MICSANRLFSLNGNIGRSWVKQKCYAAQINVNAKYPPLSPFHIHKLDKGIAIFFEKLTKYPLMFTRTCAYHIVPTKKNDSNSRTLQDFFFTFSRTFPRLSTKFQDFRGLLRSCTNSNNKHTSCSIYNSSFNSKSKNKYLS